MNRIANMSGAQVAIEVVFWMILLYFLVLTIRPEIPKRPNPMQACL